MGLSDYIHELIRAINEKDTKKQAKIYRALEKVGVDRYTANVAAYAISREESE